MIPRTVLQRVSFKINVGSREIRMFSVPKASLEIGPNRRSLQRSGLLPESFRKSIPQLVNVLTSHRRLPAPESASLDLPNHQALAGSFHNALGHLS